MSDTQTNMVGRVDEFTTLTKFITKKEMGVRILGINGSGGIGKTYLLDMALNNTRPEKNSTIVFRLDGRKDDINYDFIRLFNTLVSSMILPETIRNNPKHKSKEFLSRTQKNINNCYKMLDVISKEIESKGHSEEIKTLMKRLIRLGKVFNRPLPKSSIPTIIFDEIVKDEKLIDEVIDLIFDLKSFQTSSWVYDLLPPIFGNPKIKTNLFDVLTEELYLDLESVFLSNSALFPALFDKILIILDDFEVINKVFSDFLTGSFIEKFQKCPYSVGVIILGRDPLEAMGLSFKHHLASLVEPEITLKRFSKEETLLLLSKNDFSKPESEQIYKDTYGYPYLISSIIDSKGRQSALQLQLFYERITRWMNKVEKKRFDEICYLDVVNQDTLKIAFPDNTEEQIEEIRQWFKKESSIRDPDNGTFIVNPFIRRKVLELFLIELGPITYNKKVKNIQDRIKQQQTD